MSPRKRRGTYHPPRPRREVITAVLATTAVVLFTGIMVFVLGPHTSSSGTSVTTTTVPPAAGSSPPSSTATTSPAPTSSPSTSTPGG
jgi:hypothetical protein